MVCELNSFLGVKYENTENYFLQQVEAYKFVHSFPFGISMEFLKVSVVAKTLGKFHRFLGPWLFFLIHFHSFLHCVLRDTEYPYKERKVTFPKLKWTENQGNSSESESWFWLLEDSGKCEGNIKKINKNKCLYTISIHSSERRTLAAVTMNQKQTQILTVNTSLSILLKKVNWC